MSRYLILVILNIPLIALSLLSALVDFKMGKSSHRRFIKQVVIWILIFAGLASAQPIYRYLFAQGLTQTEPLSLFDVVQITGIITVLFMANRSRIKLETVERSLQDLHQELSIRLSEKETKKDSKR